MADIYNAYAQLLTVFNPAKVQLDTILDAKEGLASKFHQLCQNQLDDALHPNRDFDLPEEEVEALRLERDTWALLQELYGLRNTPPFTGPSAQSLLSRNPYTPPAILANHILQQVPTLQELYVLRQWLQDTTPKIDAPEIRKGYWTFTKYQVVHAKRTGGLGATRAPARLVKEMDPDAINRDGSVLEGDDAAYENALTQALYNFVRAGQHEEAMDLCKASGRPWRAASMRGGMYFSWGGLLMNSEEDESTDLDEAEEDWIGNRRRKLWKSACTRAALNSQLSPHDRAFHAALAPSPQTLPALLPLCRTWEDQLWARVIVLIEERMNTEMAALGGAFWDDGLSKPPQPLSDREREEWFHEVRSVLEGLKQVAVEDGPGARDPYHIAQLHVILDTPEPLVEEFAASLESGIPHPPNLIRFFAHFCLFLRSVGRDYPTLAVDRILEAYVGVLEAEGQTELIALYASALASSAVERYALFLSGLDLSLGPPERRAALLRAQDHGLDVEKVASVTAKLSADRAFKVLPSLPSQLPSVVVLQNKPLSDHEITLIRSVEWLIVLEPTYAQAVQQSNAIVRYLLGMGKVQAAQLLLSSLPPDLALHGADESESTEHVQYREFSAVWDSFTHVVDWAGDEPREGQDKENKWLKEYSKRVEKAHTQTTELLTEDWLLFDGETEIDERRRRELTRLRQIYVPELVIRLHAVLFNSRAKFPMNVKRALEFANIVADARYKLYEDFVSEEQNRLGDYLGALRTAALTGLESGGSDPFRIVSAQS